MFSMILTAPAFAHADNTASKALLKRQLCPDCAPDVFNELACARALLSDPARDAPLYCAMPCQDSIGARVSHQFFLICMWYSSSIAEMPLLHKGIASNPFTLRHLEPHIAGYGGGYCHCHTVSRNTWPLIRDGPTTTIIFK